MRALITTAAVLFATAAFANPFETTSGATVTLQNSSSWSIQYLYMSPTSDNSWGADRLGNSIIPANGGTFNLSNVPCNDYDVKLVDEDSDVCVINNVHICSSETWVINSEDLLSCQGNTQAPTVAPPMAPTASNTGSYHSNGTAGNVRVTNSSAWSIQYLYMSPTSDNNWGSDQLGNATIPANGGTFTLNSVPCDHFDIKLVDEDSDVCVIHDVEFCGGGSWTIESDALLACQAAQSE